MSLASMLSLATLTVVGEEERVTWPPEIREVRCALFVLEVILTPGVRTLPLVMLICPPLSVREPRPVDDPTLRIPSELIVTAEVGEIWLS
jgi:hypothetical protein